MRCADLLVPRDVLKPRRPDEHFAPEAQAATQRGIGVHLVDHDAIVAGDLEGGLAGLSGSGDEFVYRGWMMSPPCYEAFEQALSAQRIELRTSAVDFGCAHQLPNWYPALERFTPSSVWTGSPDLDEFLVVADRLGPGRAVIRDYSKSEKHYWEEAMFIPELADRDRAVQIAERLVELRGSAFDTGFVIRRFEDLEPVEWRTWWVDELPDDELGLSEIASGVQRLRLRFASVDLARSADNGQLRVIEIGDGQVSDRPTTCDPTRFISAITGTEHS